MAVIFTDLQPPPRYVGSISLQRLIEMLDESRALEGLSDSPYAEAATGALDRFKMLVLAERARECEAESKRPPIRGFGFKIRRKTK